LWSLLFFRQGRNADVIGLVEGMCVYRGPNVLLSTLQFTAVLSVSKSLDIPLLPGSSLEIYIHGYECECILSKIIAVESKANTAIPIASQGSKAPKSVPPDSRAQVEIACDKPLVIERFSDFPLFGQFILRNRGKTVATGQCI